MTEAAVTISLLLVLVTVVLAEPAIVLLGDERYRDAAPILQVQAFALLGIFLSQVWTLGLISMRRQRDVAVANGIVLVLVLVVGVVLVGAYDGIGGAAAAVSTEAMLAVLVFWFLARADRDVAPRLGFLPRPLVAGAAGALVTLLPLSPWVVAPLAAAVFIVVAFAVRAVPPEIVLALRGRDPR
jgi:O-antigen/teichoic acid export membrane protein